MSEAWEGEGFGVEDDWSEESVESDLEEEDPLEPDELEGDAALDASADESEDGQ